MGAVSRARLVPLVRVTDLFQARVLAARLESEGIASRLQGAVDGPYPLGEVAVLVPEPQLAAASEVLLADEVDAVFEALAIDEAALDAAAAGEPADDAVAAVEVELARDDAGWEPRRPRWQVAVAVVVLTFMLLPFAASLSDVVRAAAGQLLP